MIDRPSPLNWDMRVGLLIVKSSMFNDLDSSRNSNKRLNKTPLQGTGVPISTVPLHYVFPHILLDNV